MKRKNKLLAAMLIMSMFAALLSGCGAESDTPVSTGPDSDPDTSTEQPASNYPEQAISTIIPKGAGGITDTLTRSLLSQIEETNGDVSFYCENIPGASGIVGMTKCALAEPDGYTICLVPAEICQLANIPSYNCAVSVDDFRYVAVISSIPMLLCVRTDSGYEDIYDFVDKLDANTKIGNSGTYGMGDMAFIAAAQGWGKTGTGVPYADGDAAAITAMVADKPEVDAVICCPSSTLDAQISAGNVKVLCSLGKGTAYEAPIVSELEGEYAVDIDFTTWCVVCVPDDTPDYEYNYLVDMFSKGTCDEEWISAMADMYITTASICGEDADTYVRSQFDYYKELITQLGIE